MRVKVLGSAAGGGFPQWNCACPNCRRIRAANFPGKARSQAGVAVSDDGISWFLLGASPDLRSQIESSPELHPRVAPRDSPISGVLLLNAELDHVLGLLLLREFQPLAVYASSSVVHILRQQNSMFAMLDRGPKGVEWHSIRAGEEFQLCGASGQKSGITCKAISVASRYPAYVRDAGTLTPHDAVLGVRLTSSNGKVLAYFPSCGEITGPVREALEGVDLLLLDGTFYSDDELPRVLGSGARAREMGHLPVGGANGSLQQLRSIHCEKKLYIHINNTNPMLDESSAEHRTVRDAGWELAEDRWQAVL